MKTPQDEKQIQEDEPIEKQVADIHWLAFSMALRGFEEKAEKERRSSRAAGAREERRRQSR